MKRPELKNYQMRKEDFYRFDYAGYTDSLDRYIKYLKKDKELLEATERLAILCIATIENDGDEKMLLFIKNSHAFKKYKSLKENQHERIR